MVSRDMAQSVLDAIRTRILDGVDPEDAVAEWGRKVASRGDIRALLAAYLDEQAALCDAEQISPNHLRELRRCSRPDGLFSWWFGRPLAAIDTRNVRDYATWLRRDRQLGPKSCKNTLGYWHAFLTHLHRLDQIERETATAAQLRPTRHRDRAAWRGQSKSRFQRELTVRATARGSSASERDEMSFAIEQAVLNTSIGASFEANWNDDVEFERSGEGGRRTFTATYVLAVGYFTDRSDPSVVVGS